MSSKTKRRLSGATPASSAPQGEAAETKVADSARHQEIQIRAYAIYLERGEQHGRDLDDWLQAERELTTNLTGE